MWVIELCTRSSAFCDGELECCNHNPHWPITGAYWQNQGFLLDLPGGNASCIVLVKRSVQGYRTIHSVLGPCYFELWSAVHGRLTVLPTGSTVALACVFMSPLVTLLLVRRSPSHPYCLSQQRQIYFPLSNPPMSQSGKKTCSFFNRPGGCRFGDRCRDEHKRAEGGHPFDTPARYGRSKDQQISRAPHGKCDFFWSTGFCKRAFRCKFEHILKSSYIISSFWSFSNS